MLHGSGLLTLCLCSAQFKAATTQFQRREWNVRRPPYVYTLSDIKKQTKFEIDILCQIYYRYMIFMMHLLPNSSGYMIFQSMED